MSNLTRRTRVKEGVKCIESKGPGCYPTPRKPLSSKHNSTPRLEHVLNPFDCRLYAAPSNPYPQYADANHSYIQIASVVSHPFSRGSIHINTSDPTAYPDIDLNAWALDIGAYIYVYMYFTSVLTCLRT